MNDQDLCDEEISYNDWVSNNLEYINQNKVHITVMKKLYMEGFAAGYIHHGKVNAEEQLQK
jgi:hypothetical protein